MDRSIFNFFPNFIFKSIQNHKKSRNLWDSSIIKFHFQSSTCSKYNYLDTKKLENLLGKKFTLKHDKL